MGKRIFSIRNVNRYDQRKTGWDLYSLVFDPVPLLALRNLNDYDEARFSDSTLSWLCTDHNASHRVFNKSRFTKAITLSCWTVFLYGGTRGKKVGPIERKCHRKLPGIVKTFIDEMKKRKIDCVADIHPKNKGYWETVSSIAQAVSQVSSLKGSDNPMFGSKVLHFLMPEFFPVWDTEIVRNKALRKEKIPKLPSVTSKELKTKAAKTYARYINLMLDDYYKVSPREYAAIEKRMLERAWGEKYYQMTRKVADWHYADLTPTVFEVCLLGKWL